MYVVTVLCVTVYLCNVHDVLTLSLRSLISCSARSHSATAVYGVYFESYEPCRGSVKSPYYSVLSNVERSSGMQLIEESDSDTAICLIV